MTTFDLKDTERWRKYVENGMRAAVERGLYSAAVRLVSHIQTDIIPALVPVPMARGMYRAGWRPVKIDGGGAVVNTVPHAVFIEEGVRAKNVKPGRQMIQALAEWVRMKGIGGRTTGSGKRVKATMTEAVSIAWAIAKSMQQRGIFNGGTGLGVLRTAVQSAAQFAREEVAREMQQEFDGKR